MNEMSAPIAIMLTIVIGLAASFLAAYIETKRRH